MKTKTFNGIPLEIIKSRRKTISIEITREETIRVRAPLSMRERDIRYFLDEKQSWILRTLEKVRKAREEVRNGSGPGVGPGSGRRVQTAAERAALMQAAKADLPGRCARWAPLVGVTYGRITIRQQKTRWGSCSSAGNLNFNCLLMEMPEAIRDYVVVHELCHRKQMNHSAAFWREVERVMPDYQIRRKWLREHGRAYMVTTEEQIQ